MDSHWQARRLLDSAHRLGFVAAAAVMASAAAGWLALLLAPPRAAGTAGMPASAVHGLLFVFGFLPLFFAGFLFTVGPRWLGHAMDHARHAALTRRVHGPLLVYAAVWLVWWPAWQAAGVTLAPAAGLAIAALA